jgi:hypothetical protein
MAIQWITLQGQVVSFASEKMIKANEQITGPDDIRPPAAHA